MAEGPCPMSMAGMISDHTEAATITPEAKPSRSFCTSGGISRLMKKTKADPRAVPRKGIINAAKTGFILLQKSLIIIFQCRCLQTGWLPWRLRR